jgi:DnaJ-class molecular chaperone
MLYQHNVSIIYYSVCHECNGTGVSEVIDPQEDLPITNLTTITCTHCEGHGENMFSPV